MAILLAFLLQSAALAEEPAEPQMTAPLASVSVADLHDEFVESAVDAGKIKALERLERTPPEGTRDIQSLFDLFMRFPDTRTRDAVLNSLSLMSVRSPDIDVLLVHYLEQPEPEAQIFALKAAVRARDTKALPLIEKIADRKFGYKSINDAVLLSDKNAWWVQYEALASLAQWKGDAVLPLLIKRSEQATEVARIMGRFLWKSSLPTFLKWAASSSSLDQDRARAGLSAPAPAPDLRDTRPQLLAVLRDPKAPREARHQLAIKAGLTSTHEEAADLLKEYEPLKSEEDRLMFKAALFATRDNLVVPLLIQTVKEDVNAGNRAGAVVQLKDMISPKELRPILEWVLKNDPDQDNRGAATRELNLLAR